jgi:hypothetical protein
VSDPVDVADAYVALRVFDEQIQELDERLYPLDVEEWSGRRIADRPDRGAAPSTLLRPPRRRFPEPGSRCDGISVDWPNVLT